MLRWLKKRSAVHFFIVALFVIPMVAVLSIVPNNQQPYRSKLKFGLDSLEYATVDYRIQYGRKAMADPQIVLLSIDAPSISLDALDDQTIAASIPLTLMRANGFPFPREIYAEVCDRLISAGAKVVAFDLLFQKPSPTDPAFLQALTKYHDQVVIGLNFSDDSDAYFIPPTSLIPSGDAFDDQLGFLNFWQDSDEQMIRRTQYRNNLDYINGHVGAEKLPMLYSLAARVMQRDGHSGLVPNDPAPRQMRFAGPSRFATYSLYTIFDPDSWQHNFQNGDYFRGKIVVVGPAGNWSKDVFLTPVGNIPGVEIHLNAINSLLQNEFLYPASSSLSLSTVIGSGLIALLLALTIVSIFWRFLAALLVVGGYLAALICAYNGPGWLLPAVAPLSVFGGATGVGFVYDFVLTQIEKLRLRSTFERYNSKNVVKYLLENTESYKEMLAGTRQPVTILFSDVRGFTTIAEGTADTHRVVNKLNEYLTAMVDCVFRYDGTLSSFMGDGIMAVWGNTPANFGPKEDTVRAVRAALAMFVELRKLNAKWLAEGGTEWQIGIGLNQGQVIVGDIGSQQRKEFATIGDATNLSARLESLTKEYRQEILVGETVAELVGDVFHLKSVAFVQVKGKKQAIKTFTVLGEKSAPLPPDDEKFLSLYEEGIAAFRTREFARGRELFTQALQIKPDDFLAGYYVEGCDEYIETPPDASWTGIRVMTKK